MNVTYGIKVAPEDDRYIAVAEKALGGMSEAAKPGAFLPCSEIRSVSLLCTPL